MFTGLIQSIGTLKAVTGSQRERRLRIHPQAAWSDLKLGESIAVNGVCLSVENFSSTDFAAYASEETLEHSTLGALRPGDRLNLERALALGDRLGGHMVSGHVDCLARVERVQPVSQSLVYRINFDPQWSRYVVPKGSVALDGVSLTVNDCGPGFLEVNIIPATQAETTIRQWRSGTQLNMEIDMIAKYVQSMLLPWVESSEDPGEASRVNMEFLHRHGFGE